jgi:predicted methyltransferase MtxX (methanogen marker protein 4)
VAGLEHQREDVVALGEVLGGAALGDLGRDQLVDRFD